ncbi:unnamed protein product [Rotaria sp. Silwood2]|nr:unnamed protein product [Rotaria sp. Silwood2]CAF3254598.1 unnamed protein product [Rotaria sp. Silwood2]CAF4117772.1 unnamed protein product [Rotaria sp. Silwood2]CAF4161127.1 unnamed protein product [Rotaria sp. Silwood2]
MDANFAIKIPEGMNPSTSTPLYCASITVYKALKVSQARAVYDDPGDKHSEWVQTTRMDGVQVAIVTVPLIEDYDQAFKLVKRGGRVVPIALPSDKMSIPIVGYILNGIALVKSLVGTRQYLQLAKLHQIACKVQKQKLKDINYKISGRVVLNFSAK